MSKKPERSQGIHPAVLVLPNAIIPLEVVIALFFGSIET